jgi:hypothetical protein
MPKRNLLLLAAVAGMIAFVCMLVGFSVGIGFARSEGFIDEGMKRRQSVENSLDSILPAEIESADSPEFTAAVERLKMEPYVVWVWVVDPEGAVLLSYNGPAKEGDNVYFLSKYEEDLLFSVEKTRIDPVTEMELRLAMALRREGEHNDIYGHMVRQVPGPDGKAKAFVGITFEAVDAAPEARDIVFLILGAAGILIYWLGLPLWVLLDMRAAGGGRTALLWAFFVLIANAAGLMAYLLVKHRSA